MPELPEVETIVADLRPHLAGRTIVRTLAELVRAARNVGTPSTEDCPICEDNKLVHVSYVFGSRMPAHGRCITTMAEMAKLDRGSRELACYVVEVCPECSWNHLSRTFPLGRARTPAS